jgi:hypothetical protein
MVGPSMLDGSSRKVNCRNIAIALKMPEQGF